MRSQPLLLAALAACALAGKGCDEDGNDPPAAPTAHRAELPKLERDSRCPRTPGGQDARGVAITLGSGPAYPVLGFSVAPPRRAGVVELGDDLRRGRYYVHKTLWALSPDSPSVVSARGRQLGGGGKVRFLVRPGEVRTTLRLSRSRNDWAYATTATLLPGAGCFGFEIEGEGVAEAVIFRAVIRSTDGPP